MKEDKHIKDLINILGFTPKEGYLDIYSKKYPNGYSIHIDFNNHTIFYGGKIKVYDKDFQNITKPEDWVVLECVNKLLEKGYKPENIQLEKIYPAGHGFSGRLDVCVTRDDGSEYLLIECKTYGKEFDKAFARLNKDGGQLFTYFKFSNKADLLMLYASNLSDESIISETKIVKIENEYRLGDVKDFYNNWSKQTTAFGIWENLPYDFKPQKFTKNNLKELTEDESKKLFNGFASILRKHSVSDKPNAFNKIFNLFLAKLYDEAKGQDEELEFHWRENDDPVEFQIRLINLHKGGLLAFLQKEVEGIKDSDFKAATPEELREAKKKILKFNKFFDIKEVDNDATFEANHRVLKEVVQLLENYQIRYPRKQQHLSNFFERLLTTGLKQEVGQYFTPPPITKFIVRSLPLEQLIIEAATQNVPELPAAIDYAAGSGHFITEILEEYQDHINKINPEKAGQFAQQDIKSWQINPYSWAGKYIYGIEKDSRLVKVAKVGCYFYGDGLAQIIHGDGLDSFKKSRTYRGLLKHDSDLSDSTKGKFMVVASNPPYSVNDCKDDLEYIGSQKDFTLYPYLTDKSKDIESLFVERTKHLLKDEGVAGVILPSSILSNNGIQTKAREVVLQNFDIVAITELGSNTFMATGTNTVVLFLRRRNNAEFQKLSDFIAQFTVDYLDNTVKFGKHYIEKPVSKYVQYVWENISLADYLTLLKQHPNENILKHEYYIQYRKKIKAKTEKEFWDKIIQTETEKIIYFLATFNQKVVIVKSGEKDDEKRFLGYKFSDRRGSEGMSSIQSGKTIDEATRLYNANRYDDPTKASTYIQEAFKDDYTRAIDETLKNNVFRMDLSDMLTFDRVEFEKNISLAVKKKVKIESRWEIVKLENVIELISGQSPESKFYNHDKKGVPFYQGKTEFGELFLEQPKYWTKKTTAVSIKNDILMSVRAPVGPVNINPFDKICIGRGLNALRVSDNILNVYLFYYLKTNQHQIKGNDGAIFQSISREQILSIKIPLPPLEIQQKIVDEIEVLERKEKEAKEKVEEFKSFIINLMDLNITFTSEKLENLAVMLKRGKSSKYGDSNIQIIKSGQARGIKEFDFSQKYFVTDNFTLDERKLEKGDILINSTGVGTAGRVTLFNLDGAFVVDSHITILRPDTTKVLPDYMLQSLVKIGFKNIEALAMGQSGQIELSIPTIQDIKIPLPPLSEQQRIVSEIEKIEEKINALEKELFEIPAQKEAVLKKYLV